MILIDDIFLVKANCLSADSNGFFKAKLEMYSKLKKKNQTFQSCLSKSRQQYRLAVRNKLMDFSKA